MEFVGTVLHCNDLRYHIISIPVPYLLSYDNTNLLRGLCCYPAFKIFSSHTWFSGDERLACKQ